MSDYAEPLLKIKAAIKELETLLPNGKVEDAFDVTNALSDEVIQLRWVLLAKINGHQQAA